MNICPNMPVTLPPLVDLVERRLWTVEDLRRLEDAGILQHDERIELIAGEPGKDGYGATDTLSASEPLRPSLVPSLAVRLAELDLG